MERSRSRSICVIFILHQSFYFGTRWWKRSESRTRRFYFVLEMDTKIFCSYLSSFDHVRLCTSCEINDAKTPSQQIYQLHKEINIKKLFFQNLQAHSSRFGAVFFLNIWTCKVWKILIWFFITNRAEMVKTKKSLNVRNLALSKSGGSWTFFSIIFFAVLC